MDILSSIFGLVKNNNGFFKSEKQAEFLISQMEKLDGNIGFTSSGYHSCPIFASWDEKGIIKIIKHSKTKSGCKDIVTFERTVKGVLNGLQFKEIASLKRRVKSLEKDLQEKRTSFAGGSYNSSGDVSTYTNDMIDRYNRICQSLENQISSLKNLIDEKENIKNWQ